MFADGAIQDLTFHQGAACWELPVVFVLRIRVNDGGKEVASLFSFELVEGIEGEGCCAHVHN